jgi:WD40 repeat protein
LFENSTFSTPPDSSLATITTSIIPNALPIFHLIQRKLLSRSERVKSVDFHPTETWVLASLYNGKVLIWNYETQVCILSFFQGTGVGQISTANLEFILI